MPNLKVQSEPYSCFMYLVYDSIFKAGIETSHGLRTPNEAFFIEIQNVWVCADKLWGIWGIFGQTISTHFGKVSPLSISSIIQPLFLQKNKPFYPHPKYLWDVNLGSKELGI